VVLQSKDRGNSWSEPIVAVTSSQDGPDSRAVTDGSAFFDSDSDSWHLLFQCLGHKGRWNLCHYTRDGLSPMGPFTPDPRNPVIVGGALWSRICAGNGKACPATMIDEGSVQIIRKSDGFFYVTFHGADDGPPVTGARGIARTRDLGDANGWQVAGADLPGDAMLSGTDCNRWAVHWKSGGCIGTGDASLLRSGGYNYMLVEASDVSLLCTPGQNWVFGLVRSRAFGRSGTWASYGGNPFVVPAVRNPLGCSLQYMVFVRDRGETFLHFGFYRVGSPSTNITYRLLGGTGATQLSPVVPAK
jgi:hypothetical protein